MGKQLPQDDEDWDLPDEEALKELSPLQGALQPGLFQRIARQRAAYFADVEMAQGGIEDEERVLPSGFADLSTWCCDVFPPTRARSAPLAECSPGWLSIADQPTVALSLLPLPQMHIADMPTLPNLSALSASVPGDGLRKKRAFLWAGGHPGEIWRQLWRRLLRAWHACTHRVRRARKVRSSASNGHELLMQRLREKGQGSASPSRFPGKQHPRQVRLPADRLVR